MGQITIYPSDELEKVIREEAERQNRNVNNFLIYILTTCFDERLKKRENN